MAGAGGSWKGGTFKAASSTVPTFEEFSATYTTIDEQGRAKSFQQYVKERGEAPIGEIDYGLLIFGGMDKYLTAAKRGQRQTMLKREARQRSLYNDYKRNVPMVSSQRTADFTRQQDQAARRVAYRRLVRSMGGAPQV